jgi:mannosyltransferase OCH1-like enzyme
MSIPKIIHYCWFGGKPLPELAKKCISSWKKYCPDYELILWNEKNFDVNIISFTSQVAKTEKWAFITDFLRAHVIFYYGGIYLDTDVELLKPFDDAMLQNKCFSGFENIGYVNPGNIFAGEKGCVIAKELMDFYSSYNFINKKGKLNCTPIPSIFSNMLLKYGLKQNNYYQDLCIITIYPTEYFCPKDFQTGIISITDNTYSIHHYEGSWLSDDKKKSIKERWDFYKKYGDDEYLVNMYNELKDYEKKTIYHSPLKLLYKTAIKRTIKNISKIFKK